MTLDKYVANGGNMLSDWSAGWACKALTCNVRQLRTMDLTVIFAVCPLAVREISRYCRERGRTLADFEQPQIIKESDYLDAQEYIDAERARQTRLKSRGR